LLQSLEQTSILLLTAHSRTGQFALILFKNSTPYLVLLQPKHIFLVYNPQLLQQIPHAPIFNFSLWFCILRFYF